MKWQCYLETEMGLEFVTDQFPNRMNVNDVTRAFQGRYGCSVQNVCPASDNYQSNSSYGKGLLGWLFS